MHAVSDLDATNLVIWPKWCYANSLKEDKLRHDIVLNNLIKMNNHNNNNHNNNNNNRIRVDEKDNLLTLHGSHPGKKPRRKTTPHPSKTDSIHGVVNGITDVKPLIKMDSESPELGVTDGASTHPSPSPSASPKSPASHRTRTPSFSGTPPHPAFTPPATTLHPPYDRISPGSLGAATGLPPGPPGSIKQMETMMARNCSDLMRSLAAKYNNSNPNDYFSIPRHNEFLRSPINPLGHLKGIPYPSLGENPITSSTTTTTHIEKKTDIHVPTIPASSVPQGIPQRTAPPLFPTSGITGFPGFPLVNVSSTQVLLNMVRNASTVQQPQLDNYLKSSMKRPLDGPTSPLDLSSSVGTKRLRTDINRSFDVKNLFPDGEKRTEEKGPEKAYSPPAAAISPMVVRSPPTASPGTNSTLGKLYPGVPCGDRECPSLEKVLRWTVEDVCDFVRGIDLCAEYVEAFREHRIDGSSLPLLTEEHLTTSIQMKLGPALKLRSVLARKMGSCGVCLHCTHCHSPPGERLPPNPASLGR